jgi:hypothetical protein
LVEDPGCCPVGISSSGPCGSADNVLPIVLRSKTRSDSDCLVSTRHLSWGFQRSSLHRHQPATSTPAFLPRLPAAFPRFGPLLPRAGLVPPSRFLTALTAYSVVDSAGLLHPAADPGIHRVPAFSGSSCDSPVLSFHDASPFEAFSSPAAFRSLRSLPSYRSPSKDGPISGSFSAGRVRRLSHVLPHVEARGSLGFLRVVFRLSSSWSPVPKDGVQGGSGSRCRTRRPTDFIETKSGWQTRSPHDPRESENSFSQVFCAWRLRPCAGLCGSWVTNPGVTKTRPPLTKRV